MIEGTIHQPSVQIHEERIELPESSRIDAFTFINAAGGVTFGPESCIHPFSAIVGSGGCDIGTRAVVTYHVTILTSTADLRFPASSVVPKEERGSVTGRVWLREESFVGSGARLMPGVTIGKGAVVAANAYVDRDVPDGMVLYPNGELRERPGRW